MRRNLPRAIALAGPLLLAVAVAVAIWWLFLRPGIIYRGPPIPVGAGTVPERELVLMENTPGEDRTGFLKRVGRVLAVTVVAIALAMIGTILLVEDNALIRADTAIMLEEMGHTVAQHRRLADDRTARGEDQQVGRVREQGQAQDHVETARAQQQVDATGRQHPEGDCEYSLHIR